MRILAFLLLLIPYSSAAQQKGEVTSYTENNLYGLQTKTGKKLTKAIYDEAPFIDDFNKVCSVSKGGKMGFISLSGKEITPLIYDDAGFFSSKNGLCSVTKDEKYGFINMAGNVEIPLIYDYTDLFFTQGVCAAYLEGKAGLIDEAGGIVVPFEYDEFGLLSDDRDLFPVRKGELWGFMNFKGEITIPITYVLALPFNGEKALIFNQTEFFYINRANQKISQSYYYVASLSDELFVLQNKDKSEFYLFDESEDDIRSEIYQAIYAFSEDLAIVKQNGKFGYIDSNGDIVIPCIYSYAQPFIQGKAEVTLDDEPFEIDATGTKISGLEQFSGDEVLEFTFDDLFDDLFQDDAPDLLPLEKMLTDQKYDVVIQKCNDMLQEDDARVDVYFYSGKAKYLKKQYRLAYNDFKLFLENQKIFNHLPEGNYLMGMTLFELKEPTEACEKLVKADSLGFADAAEMILKMCK